MRITRRAEEGDLSGLLDLYRHLNSHMPDIASDQAQKLWAETLSGNPAALFVTAVGETIVASCLLITAPNLLRGGSPHAFIENVVTHSGFRRQGHGRATVDAALGEAWRRNCRRVLLVTGRGRTDPGVLDFYEDCGFEAGRAGLVAWRPATV